VASHNFQGEYHCERQKMRSSVVRGREITTVKGGKRGVQW